MNTTFKVFLLFCSIDLRKKYLEIEDRNAVNQLAVNKFAFTFAFLLIFYSSILFYVTYISIHFYLESGWISVIFGWLFIISTIYFSLYRPALNSLQATALAYSDGEIIKGIVTDKSPLVYGPLRVLYSYNINNKKYKGFFITGPWVFCYGKWKKDQEIEIIYAKSSPKYSQLFEKDKFNFVCLDKEKFI